MQRFRGWSLAPMLVVLATLFARVDIASKALHGRLWRFTDARAFGLGWLDAFRVSGVAPISGGALTEGVHTGGFLASEASGWRSRESITIASGQNLKAGTMLGKTLQGVAKAAIPTVVGTGNGVMSGVFVGPDVIAGSYVITLKTVAANGGVFSVVNPAGKALDDATVAVAYRTDEINFTIADGATDFILNDVFTLVVGAGTPAVVGTGNGIVSAISLGPNAKPGRYLLRNILGATNSGTFELVDPDGDVIATRTIPAGAGASVAFVTDQLNVTVADGATDYITGDFFEFAVANLLAPTYTGLDSTSTTGANKVAGILYGDVDATLAAAKGVAFVRDCEVNEFELVWPTGVSAAEKQGYKNDLAALGIIVRR